MSNADLITLPSPLRACEKIYSLHAPEVECIGKGNAHKPYESGVKVSIAPTLNYCAGGQSSRTQKRCPAIPMMGTRWRLSCPTCKSRSAAPSIASSPTRGRRRIGGTIQPMRVARSCRCGHRQGRRPPLPTTQARCRVSRYASSPALEVTTEPQNLIVNRRSNRALKHRHLIHPPGSS